MVETYERRRTFSETMVGLFAKAGIGFGSALSFDALQTSVGIHEDPPKPLLGIFLGLHVIASAIHFDDKSQNSPDQFVKSVTWINECINGIANSKEAEKVRVTIKAIGIASIIALPYAINILVSHPDALDDHPIASIITKLALGLGTATTLFDASKIYAKFRERKVNQALADYESQPQTNIYEDRDPFDPKELIPTPYKPDLFRYMMPDIPYAERAEASNTQAVQAHKENPQPIQSENDIAEHKKNTNHESVRKNAHIQVIYQHLLHRIRARIKAGEPSSRLEFLLNTVIRMMNAGGTFAVDDFDDGADSLP